MRGVERPRLGEQAALQDRVLEPVAKRAVDTGDRERRAPGGAPWLGSDPAQELHRGSGRDTIVR